MGCLFDCGKRIVGCKVVVVFEVGIVVEVVGFDSIGFGCCCMG